MSKEQDNNGRNNDKLVKAVRAQLRRLEREIVSRLDLINGTVGSHTTKIDALEQINVDRAREQRRMFRTLIGVAAGVIVQLILFIVWKTA